MFPKSETDKKNTWVCLHKLKLEKTVPSLLLIQSEQAGGKTENMVNLDTEIVMYQ